MDILFEYKPININFYWICADYHIYQTSIITNKLNPKQKISQLIFGTGGGKLDEPVLTNYMEIDNYILNIQQNIVYDSSGNDISLQFNNNYGVNKFGYGEITFNLCSITHKFIMSDYIIENNSKKDKKIKTGGNNNINYMSKYLKYKTKYIKLKKFFL